VEIASALMRRSRDGEFADAERVRAFAALPGDLAALLVVELTPDIVSLSEVESQTVSAKAAGPQGVPGDHRRSRSHGFAVSGSRVMFWLTRNRLAGSYSSLICRRRA
jgi:hypothetical protein